jgi:hypothetical protein
MLIMLTVTIVLVRARYHPPPEGLGDKVAL